MQAKKIQQFKPCTDALKFVQSCKTYKEAWETCERGDWMLWIAAKLKVNERKLFLAKGKCAETVIHLMQDQRSKDAVKAAIDFGEGIISKKKLEAAAKSAAYAAAFADADAAAAYAAADADAAYVAAYADARTKNLKQTADICREILRDEVFKQLNTLK